MTTGSHRRSTPISRRFSRTTTVAASLTAAAAVVTAVSAVVTVTPPAAVASPAPAAPASGPAVVNPAFQTLADADADGYVPEDEAGWRKFIYKDDGTRYTRMEELKVHSPAMGRDIPVVTIRARDNADTAPTIYLLNGADGGAGTANWLQQTSAIDFYGDRLGNVNVVIPMAGYLSYYTDWQQESVLDTDGNGHGGRQMWETFLTAELPGAVEKHLGTGSERRALVGMSMTGSTVLVYGEQHPGLYDAIASYSGCPATSGVGAASVDATFTWTGSKVTYEQMWGDRNGEVARRNDAQANVDKLRDQHNIYVSSGTGLMGEHDVPSGDRLRGNPVGSLTVAGQGGAIETGTNTCTHLFRAAADKAGVTPESNNIVYNFRNTGTHQWGYWQDDMFASWPTLSAGLFGPESADGARAAADAAAADYLAGHQGIGTAGSLPVLDQAFREAQDEAQD